MDGDSRGAQLASEVVVGRDGFLFNRWNRAFEQICDGVLLEPHDLRFWVNTIEFRHAWAAMHGIPYFVQIVPERHAVYGDHLPPGIHVAADRPVNQLHRALDRRVADHFTYPIAALRVGRLQAHTFFHTDIHPSRYGMYLCYRDLARLVGAPLIRDVVREDELVRAPRKRRIVGDLGVRLPDEPTEEIEDITISRPFAVRRAFTNKSFLEGQVMVFENDDRSLPRLVIFRDSNATHVIDPFLTVHFSRIVSVGGWGFFFPELIRAEKPDVVVSMFAERFIGTPLKDGTAAPVALPNNLTGPTFEQFTGVALPLP
jgi:hypothetical protein